MEMRPQQTGNRIAADSGLSQPHRHERNPTANQQADKQPSKIFRGFFSLANSSHFRDGT
jgi:hypothetical protein